jgi:hypothetical protein
MASFRFDYVARQKIGGTSMTYFYVKQFPAFPPATYNEPVPWLADTRLDSWIDSRVLELVYTAWDLQPFARDLADNGSPFRWNPKRRELLRAELDAAFFRIYEVSRDDAEHILDTFWTVRNRDEAQYGEYRTKRLILEVYDAMQRAIDTGVPYWTILDPPPGQGPRHPDRSKAVA